MPADDFQSRLDQLKSELYSQADKVLQQALLAVDCYFSHDQAKQKTVEENEGEIDRVDVEIERHSIPLLGMGQTDPYAIRSVLTIVKVNNELERITDCAANIANASTPGAPTPHPFKVMQLEDISTVEQTFAGRCARMVFCHVCRSEREREMGWQNQDRGLFSVG